MSRTNNDTIEVRQGRSKSWLDKEYQHVLSAQLADRLVSRTQGESGLFLTLTYRRDEYQCPADLYHATSRRRDVRRFIESLANYLGESLSGRWLCKLEFQRGGWVHFHLILLGVRRIDHTALQDIWGHGYVWINRLTPSRIRYACKYISKGEELPSFLYLEPVRSVKIIRVSPGFWGDTRESGGGEPTPPELRPTKISGCYVPIGTSIQNQRSSTISRTQSDDGEYNYKRTNKPAWKIILEAVAKGYLLVGTFDGWTRLKRSSCTHLVEVGNPARSAGCPPPGASRSDALHLIDNRNPPIRFPWLERYLRDFLTCQNLRMCEGGV